MIEKFYKEIVLLLLGVLPENQIDLEKVSETAKVGIKNYIKMFKKLITFEQKSEENEIRIKDLLKETNRRIAAYIRQHEEKKQVGTITLELISELRRTLTGKVFEAFVEV